MSLTVDDAFVTAITSGEVKIAEIYDITLSIGTVYHYTNHGEDIEWGSPLVKYQSIPIKRESIGSHLSLEPKTTQLTLQNITGELYDLLMKNVLDNAQITIKQILWNETYSSGLEAIKFQGTIDIEFDRQTLVLKCISILDSLNITVPKNTFQEPCNHRLFDGNCSLTRADYAYNGTASENSSDNFTLIDGTADAIYQVSFDQGDITLPIEVGDTLTGQTGGGTGVVVNVIYLTATTGKIWFVEQGGVLFVSGEELQNAGGDSVFCSDSPASDTTFYELGEIEILTGNNIGVRRMIISSSSDIRTVGNAFPNGIVSGDTYAIYPGCDKTGDTCVNRFNNGSDFMGFPYIPNPEETIL